MNDKEAKEKALSCLIEEMERFVETSMLDKPELGGLSLKDLVRVMKMARHEVIILQCKHSRMFGIGKAG